MMVELFVERHWGKILEWIEEKRKVVTPEFYNSCDVRFSGFKVASVDCNMFPAGFKNLSQDGIERSVTQVKSFCEDRQIQTGQNVCIIAESHTRNVPYMEGVFLLKTIIEKAGFSVRIATIDLKKSDVLIGERVETVFKLRLDKERLVLEEDSFVPDLFILNNDLTKGMPKCFAKIEQKIYPAKEFGWFNRKKSIHFNSYNELVNEFAASFEIDPWLFSSFYSECKNVDFKERSGGECLSLHVEKVLRQTQEKYDQYGVKLQPKVFVKPNAGTYGMGIFVASNSSDVLSFNKHDRNKLDKIKGGQKNNNVLIQEGVYSIDTIDQFSAEPVVYGFNGVPCDIFYRFHNAKDSNDNLNQPGSMFKNIKDFDLISSSSKLKCYFVTATLAFLSCYYEMQGNQES